MNYPFDDKNGKTRKPYTPPTPNTQATTEQLKAGGAGGTKGSAAGNPSGEQPMWRGLRGKSLESDLGTLYKKARGLTTDLFEGVAKADRATALAIQGGVNDFRKSAGFEGEWKYPGYGQGPMANPAVGRKGKAATGEQAFTPYQGPLVGDQGFSMTNREAEGAGERMTIGQDPTGMAPVDIMRANSLHDLYAPEMDAIAKQNAVRQDAHLREIDRENRLKELGNLRRREAHGYAGQSSLSSRERGRNLRAIDERIGGLVGETDANYRQQLDSQAVAAVGQNRYLGDQALAAGKVRGAEIDFESKMAELDAETYMEHIRGVATGQTSLVDAIGKVVAAGGNAEAFIANLRKHGIIPGGQGGPSWQEQLMAGNEES